MSQALYLIGSAYGFGAGNTGCEHGPQALKDYLTKNPQPALHINWAEMIQPAPSDDDSNLERIAALNQKIAKASHKLIQAKHFPVNIGGDHSCAIGMWSGIASAMRDKGDMGLIWIDAHLDAHTFETTPTGNIHGMPVAALLGYGELALTSIGDTQPKIKPENLVVLGARSYEPGEHDLLRQLGVKIYYMDDIKEKGFEACFAEAIKIVSENTIGYGLSFDLDGIDPSEAPGVGTPEEDGLKTEHVLNAWKEADFSNLIGLEIVEFNPHLDQNNLTLNLAIDTLNIVTKLLRPMTGQN